MQHANAESSCRVVRVALLAVKGQASWQFCQARHFKESNKFRVADYATSRHTAAPSAVTNLLQQFKR